MYVAIYVGLAIMGAGWLLWYALTDVKPQRKYTAWHTIERWDRAKDKSHDHRPTSIREWSDK